MPTMRPEKQNRVAVNQQQQGLAGLGQALSGLNLGSLPTAPAKETASESEKPRKLGRVILRRETAHRGGRTVIVIHDFPPAMAKAALEELARELRHAIGTGGTLRDRTIEMQGDQPAKIRSYLEKRGFHVAGVA